MTEEGFLFLSQWLWAVCRLGCQMDCGLERNLKQIVVVVEVSFTNLFFHSVLAALLYAS